MGDRRPEHYIGCKETHYLICDKDPFLALVLAKMEAWQRYVDRDPHRDEWFWMSARQMSKQMMGAVGRSNVNKYMNQLVDMGLVRKRKTDDPQEPTKWTVDMAKLAELRSKYADENGYVDATKDNDDTPSVGSDTPSVGSDTTKSPNNDYLTNKQSHERTREDQPDDPPTQPDPVSTEPPDDLTQWIVWRGKRMEYDISPQQAMKVAMGVADFGLGDDEERRYIRETMTSCAIAEKAPGQWAYYVVQRGNYETWRGETEDDTDTNTTYVDGYEW